MGDQAVTDMPGWLPLLPGDWAVFPGCRGVLGSYVPRTSRASILHGQMPMLMGSALSISAVVRRLLKLGCFSTSESRVRVWGRDEERHGLRVSIWW